MKKRQIANILILVTFTSLMAALTGCAFGDRKIALTYEAAGTASISNAPKIAVAGFDDTRQDKSLVGEVRNGMGMKTADVLLQNPEAGGWVSNALTDELQKAGFQVVKVENAQEAGGGIVISGAISKAYVTMMMTTKGQVQVSLRLTKASVPLLNKEYTGKSSALAVTASTREYEKALKKALQDIMAKAVPDIIKAVQ